MDSSRFDQLTTAGLAAPGLSEGATALAAQDATPLASPEAASEHPALLFVQLANAGSWAPKPEDDGVYLLTLTGVGSQTLYFCDRADRIVGTVPTDQFLDSLGFTPANPPNATIVVTTPAGERDVLAAELFDPVYIRTFGDEREGIRPCRRNSGSAVQSLLQLGSGDPPPLLYGAL